MTDTNEWKLAAVGRQRGAHVGGGGSSSGYIYVCSQCVVERVARL